VLVLLLENGCEMKRERMDIQVNTVKKAEN